MELIVSWHGRPDAGRAIRLNEAGLGEAITLPIVIKDGGDEAKPVHSAVTGSPTETLWHCGSI